MKISLECSWKLLWYQIKLNTVIIPFSLLLSKCGYTAHDWEWYAYIIVFGFSIALSNNTYHKQVMETK